MTPPYGLPTPAAASNKLDQPQMTRFVLDDQMIRTLMPAGIKRNWTPGDELASYGQRMEHVSVCLSGQYKVLLSSIDGQSHFMRLMMTGELFGVPSALAGTPFPTDVVCEEPGQTLDIPRQTLLRMLRSEPDLAMGVIKSLATRVTEMFDVMEADLLPSLRARVYQRLQRLAQFNGRPDRFGHIELPLTQQDIAQSLNASRPKVQQELKRLETEGVIRLGYRRITLLQLKPSRGVTPQSPP
jgi:CRP/FNR family transcriptional regulator